MALSSRALAFTFTIIDIPGATRTAAVGINAAGQIAGSYNDSSVNQHGFLLDEGTFTTIDVPGATHTAVVGISAAGRIVGNYMDSSGTIHGFAAIPAWL
jgi:uncharacterized membrane protein